MKKALLIGINYKNSDLELRGCINDVKNISDILINNCDYSSQNIKILIENGKESDLPNKQNIEDGVKWLASNLNAGDTLVFYYSGHGYYIKDTNNDERDGNDEVIVPLDYEKNGYVSDDWLYENLVELIPKDVTLWAFADCCHAGTLLDLKYNYHSDCKLIVKEKKDTGYVCSEWDDNYSFYIDRKHDVKGDVILFTGSLDEQTAADAFLSSKFQGAFTYCLIEIIKNNLVKDEKSQLKIRDIKIRNLLKELNGRLKLLRFSQNAQLSMSNPEYFEKVFKL
jgi:hypothetical protein